jgi:MFS family permease
MKHYYSWLLRLYPLAWRDRYGEEFLAMLESCPLSLGVIGDICLGAVDARLHLDTLLGRICSHMNRLRNTAIVVFCAYIGFVVAGLAFGKMVEYDDFRNLLHSDSSVAIAYWTLYAGAFAALAAVLVGGLPLAFAAARSAISDRRWGLLALFAVPPVSLAVWLGSSILVEAWNPDHGNLLSAPLGVRFVVLGLFVGTFVLAAVASTVAVSMAIVRTNVSDKLYRFARYPAIITALAMAVMFAAVLVYGLLARTADPQLFAENEGLVSTNTTATWLVILVMMGIAAAVAVVAVVRGQPGSGAAARQVIAGQTTS